MAISAAAIREELSTLKPENARLASENSEIRESLHRANTEMAELGMTICKLSAEKEEVRELWEGDTAKIEELEKEVERIESSMEELQLENAKLREELTEKVNLPESIMELQEQLENAKNQTQKAKGSSREEVDAIKFQMSSESMNHQIQMKVSYSEPVYHVFTSKVLIFLLQILCFQFLVNQPHLHLGLTSDLLSGCAIWIRASNLCAFLFTSGIIMHSCHLDCACIEIGTQKANWLGGAGCPDNRHGLSQTKTSNATNQRHLCLKHFL